MKQPETARVELSARRAKPANKKADWAFYKPQEEPSGDEIFQKRLETFTKIVGGKVQLKFAKVGDAFRAIDINRDGCVDKQEMRSFARQFNLDETIADSLFDHLDRDKSGELDYVEFMEHFGPIIQPGVPPPRTYRNPLVAGSVRNNNVAGRSLRKLG